MATITSAELGAAARYINFGSPAALDNLGSMTVMAYVRPATGSTLPQYIAQKCTSSAINGWRLQFTAVSQGSYRFGFGSDSSGSATNPSSFCVENSWAVGTWLNACVTWDGGVNESGIAYYKDGSAVAKTAVTSEIKAGSGSINSDAASEFWLMNRVDSARPFLGDVAYVAVWDRVLSASEVADARANGPLSVGSGLVFCWANQQDYGPSTFSPTARSTYAAGTTPTTYTDLGTLDVTAPTLTGATATTTGATTASGSVTTDEASGTLYSVATTSATAPTKAQVKSGQDHTEAAAPWDASQAISSTGAKSVSVTGLTASTAYYLHHMHEDAVGNQSDVATSASFTTATPDVTAPTLTSATATATGDTSASGSVSTNEANGTLYFVTSANSSESATTVKDGSSQAVTAIGTQSVSVTGLTAATAYYLHFVHRDASGNDSAVASSTQFTTSAAPIEIGFAARFDGENLDRSNSSITDAGTSTPTVNIKPRLTSTSEYKAGSYWGRFCFKLSNANGKRPLFILDAASYTGTTVTSELGSEWRPWYSYDGDTWTRWPADPTNTSGDEWTFQLPASFTAADVYVAFTPDYPVSRGLALAQWVETNAPSLISRVAEADNTDYRIGYVAAQADESGSTVPQQPVRCFALGSGSRAIVLSSGVHGYEVYGGWALEGAVKWLCGGSSEANWLLSQFTFYVFPIINPSGRWGGHWRGQWQTGQLEKDTNRDWTASPVLTCTQLVKSVFDGTLDGADVWGVFDFHSADAKDKNFSEGIFYSSYSSDNATRKALFAASWAEYFSAADYAVTNGTLLSSWAVSGLGADYSYTMELLEQAEYADLATVQGIGADVMRVLYDRSYVIITLALSNTAPAKLQSVLVTSDMGITAEEIEALWWIE